MAGRKGEAGPARKARLARAPRPGRAERKRTVAGGSGPRRVKAEDRYNDLLEFVPLGLFVLSKAGRIREVNLRGARMLGRTPEAAVGEMFLDHVAADCRGSCADSLRQALGSATRQRTEIRLLDARGTGVPVSLECGRRGNGRRGQILVSAVDLSDRIAGERRSDRLRAAVDQAAEAIAILGPEGVFRYVNRAFETANDVIRTDLMGRTYIRLLAPMTAGKGWPGEARLAMATGSVWSGRVERRNGHGRVRVLELMLSPIRDNMDRSFGFLVIEHDITRVSELEENLRRVQKSEALGTIAGGIAHDLNNILGPIIINTELARLDADEASRPLLDGVLKAAARARALVQQITAFSSPRARQMIPVRLSEIIRDASGLLRASIPSTVEIKDTTGRFDGLVEADPTQIHQVLVNLVNNAAQAMSETGGRLTIDLERIEIGPRPRPGLKTLRPGRYLRLSVADTGTGIDPDHLDKIFDPFFTTKPPGKGMGLGLSVVRGIVLGHGGAITVDSEPGRGATFSVYLPELSQAVLNGPRSDDPVPRGTGRVLLVDDEDMHLRSVQGALKKLGYVVTALTDPEAALETLRREPASFDVLFTDQTMPRRTGTSLAQAAVQIRPGLPIILFTGLSETVDPEIVQRAGIRLVLRKPLGLPELARAVKQTLGS